MECLNPKPKSTTNRVGVRRVLIMDDKETEVVGIENPSSSLK